MKCDKCGKNIATTHIHTVINGKVTDRHLCGYCAAFGGVMPSEVFINELGVSRGGRSNNICPSCGKSLSEIATSGLMGCADCYKTFSKEILSSIKKVHGRTNYGGKIPQTAAPRLSSNDMIIKLKHEMAKAVENENFELAAELRDKIKEMEA